MNQSQYTVLYTAPN